MTNRHIYTHTQGATRCMCKSLSEIFASNSQYMELNHHYHSFREKDRKKRDYSGVNRGSMGGVEGEKMPQANL